MADQGQEIGKGHVKVSADTATVDASMASLPKKFATVEVAAKRMGDQVRQSSASGAIGLMMLSQIVDDAQYGFRALVNQIPQAGMALGSAFGMASDAAMKFGGVAGIAAVAINLLINHWDDLMNAMGMGRVLTEAEQMERLAKATKLTADEAERLNRYKKEEAARNEMSQKMASGVEKTNAAVKDVIADLGDESTTGRSKLVAGLVQARRAEGAGAKMTEAEESKLRSADAFAHKGDFWKKRADSLRAKIQKRLDKEDVELAGKTVDTATFDSTRRQQLVNEIRKNPGAFPEGAADKLAGVEAAKNTADQQAADLAAKQADQLDEVNKADFDRWKQERDKEDSRLAGAMTGSVGESYLSNPKMGVEEMQAEVRKAMERAGIGAGEIAKAVEGTAKKLRENMDKAVEQRSLDRGITVDQAREQLAQEADERDRRQSGAERSQVMSTESYMSKLLVAGLTKTKDDVPDKQLVEAEKTNKKLDDLTKAVKEQKQNASYGTAAPSMR